MILAITGASCLSAAPPDVSPERPPTSPANGVSSDDGIAALPSPAETAARPGGQTRGGGQGTLRGSDIPSQGLYTFHVVRTRPDDGSVPTSKETGSDYMEVTRDDSDGGEVRHWGHSLGNATIGYGMKWERSGAWFQSRALSTEDDAGRTYHDPPCVADPSFLYWPYRYGSGARFTGVAICEDSRYQYSYSIVPRGEGSRTVLDKRLKVVVVDSTERYRIIEGSDTLASMTRKTRFWISPELGMPVAWKEETGDGRQVYLVAEAELRQHP